MSLLLCSSSPVLKKYAWNLTVMLLTATVELWVFVAFVLMKNENNSLQISLCVAIGLNFAGALALVYVIFKVICHKTNLASEDLTQIMCLGTDYWSPFPKWEWKSPPLLWNVCDYSTETGWDNIYPEEQATPTADGQVLEIPNGAENAKDVVTTSSANEGKSLASSIQFMDASSSSSSDGSAAIIKKMNEYELQYLVSAAEQKLPTVVVCICYLLSKDSNQFLLESLLYYTQVHKAPIYVMINAREQADWVEEQLHCISTSLQNNSLHQQVQIFFVKSSRSKAANLNTFIDLLLLQQDNHSRHEEYKYVLNYDIDDRPVYNETSLLQYANSVVGTKRSGHKVVGIQGPCIECFNDTLSGLFEAKYEYNAQTDALTIQSRLTGKVRSQGSNHVVLTSVFCRYRFDTTALLEDWRWSNDMAEQENLSLAFVRTMVCFGQTPSGWNAIARRRNRWNKGRWQETLHDAFGRACTRYSFKDWCSAWVHITSLFVMKPMLHMLLLGGYVVIFQEAYSQGGFGNLTLDVHQVAEKTGMSTTLGRLWNISWVACLGPMILINAVHFVLAMTNYQSSCFLNGRDSLKYRVSHFLLYFVNSFSYFYAPLTRYYQYEYFCGAEYMLEKLLAQKTEWVPTPKKAHETSFKTKVTMMEREDSTMHTYELEPSEHSSSHCST